MTTGHHAIDINADCAERPGPAGIAADTRLMPFLTSVNISCGAHAGDDQTIRGVLQAAHAHRLSIGAHPSYPDPANFGRVSMPMAAAALQESITAQLRLLRALAGESGTDITHVKPHGALYHDITVKEEVATIFINAVRAIWLSTPLPFLVTLAGSRRLHQWRAQGFAVAAEAYCERRYQPDATLVPRSQPHALIHDPDEAARQAVDIAVHRCVSTGDRLTPVRADTICIHSDSPNAQAIAEHVHTAIQRELIPLRGLGQVV